MAAAMLGDLGAEVIKIEQLGGGDPMRGWMHPLATIDRNTVFETFNRNKRGIAVNLQTEGGRDIVYKLTERADIFLTNLRSKVVTRLGLDYDSLSSINRKLVYAQASGWGPKGPDSEKGGFDNLVVARSGFMYTTGEPEFGGPQRPTVGIIDAAGASFLVLATLAALQARQRSGEGQKVDTALLGSAITLASLIDCLAVGAGIVQAKSPRTQEVNPFYNFYRCGDGEWLYISIPQFTRYWASLWEAVGQEELARRPAYQTPKELAQHSKELIAILDQVLATKPRAEWLRIFTERDILCEPIQTVGDLVNDPQVMANGYIMEYDHPNYGREKVIGIPYQFDKTPTSLVRPSPEYGQHTEEVLLEFGYEWDQIDLFKSQGVIP